MSGPIVHFVVLRSFEDVVNGRLNRYHEGRHYHARPGSTWDDLRGKIPDWERAGMVAIGLDAAAEVMLGAANTPLVLGRGAATVSER